MSTVNRTLRSYLVTILGAEYIFRLIPKGTHEWKKFISPEEISRHLKNTQSTLQVKDVQGVRIKNPFTLEFAFTRDVGINYLITLTKKK